MKRADAERDIRHSLTVLSVRLFVRICFSVDRVFQIPTTSIDDRFLPMQFVNTAALQIFSLFNFTSVL